LKKLLYEGILSFKMKVPTASLSPIFTPDKRDTFLITNPKKVKRPFLQTKLSNCNEESQQRLQSQNTVEQTKVPKPNKATLTKIETPKIRTSKDQSLQRPNFTISAVETDAYSMRVNEVTHGLRRPVASLQKLIPLPRREAGCGSKLHSFNQALNTKSSRSPTTSDPIEQQISRFPSPFRRRKSLPVLTTPLRKRTMLHRPKTTIKRFFHSRENFRRRTLEAPKRVEPKKNLLLIERNSKETETSKIQSLEDSVEKLASKLASISLREDNLKRESAFYKTVIFKIEDIIAQSQDQSVFSSLRITNF